MIASPLMSVPALSALALAGLLVAPALAATPAAVPAPAVQATALSAARTYTVAPGDTLDRVVQKTMGESPLKPELLKQALAQANPQGIPAGRNPRLKAGSVLQLPDHDALLRAVLQPLVQHAESMPPQVGGNAVGDNRRRWVRYP